MENLYRQVFETKYTGEVFWVTKAQLSQFSLEEIKYSIIYKSCKTRLLCENDDILEAILYCLVLQILEQSPGVAGNLEEQFVSNMLKTEDGEEVIGLIT